MEIEQVKQLLQQHLPDCDIEVSGDGRHFEAVIVGDVFAGLTPVKRQQLVYAGINAQIADGSLHAINMKTYTREQWRALQAR